MTGNVFSQTTSGSLAALTTSVFFAGAAFADDEPAGKAFVDRVLIPEAQLCVEDALRGTVGDADTDVKIAVEFSSDGDYRLDLSVVTLGRDFVSKSAGVRFTANEDSLRFIGTYVGASNALDMDREASVSIGGMTSHFDNAASFEFAEFTRPAEVALHDQVWTCLYGVGHRDYMTDTLDPVLPKP